MDTHAKTVDQIKLSTHLETLSAWLPHHALVTTNISVLVMPRTVMHAELANCHSSQLKTDKDVTDQDQHATASRDTPTMDIPASSAQPDKLLTQEITMPVSQPHHALVTTNILDLLMLKTAMPVELVKLHSSQLRIEPDATDQDQLATASKDTPTMDSLACNAQTDKLLTQETTELVSKLQPVKEIINISVLVMPRTAMLAEPVNFHSSQPKIDKDATDQDQLVLASKDTPTMDIHA